MSALKAVLGDELVTLNFSARISAVLRIDSWSKRVLARFIDNLSAVLNAGWLTTRERTCSSRWSSDENGGCAKEE